MCVHMCVCAFVNFFFKKNFSEPIDWAFTKFHSSVPEIKVKNLLFIVTEKSGLWSDTCAHVPLVLQRLQRFLTWDLLKLKLKCNTNQHYRYSNIQHSGATTWIMADSDEKFHFDELYLQGNAHLAVRTKHHYASPASFTAGKLIGDKSGNRKFNC